MSEPTEFEVWMSHNRPIWEAFCELADLMRQRRDRWSARAILHVLRWQSALRENNDAEFKINNRWSAPMGRLYNRMHNVQFFQEREHD
jgi:hypothetical protein